MSLLSSIYNFIFKSAKSTSKKDDKNSITVDSIDMDYPLSFEGNKVYYFTKDCYVYVKGTRHLASDGKDHAFLLTCLFKRGFMSDGASAPQFAKHFLPEVKKGDNVYNAAPFIHDGLYILKGVINGADLTRDECDDILRGIWRLAGLSRAVAGAADLGVHVFAGSDEYWGSDSLDCKHLFKPTWQYR